MSTFKTATPADGAARAAPRTKISIDECWRAGFGLLFTRLHRLVPQIWLPALALFLIEKDNLLGRMMKGCTLGSCKLPSILGVTGFEILMYGLIGASAYAVAFGRYDRWTLARLEIGAPELRYFLTKLIFTLMFYGLLIGASVFVVKIVGFLILREVIVTANPALTNAQWVAGLGPVGWAAIFSPLAFAGLIFAWFGVRFSLVFPAAFAEGRFAFFDAMALTKRNSWHLLGLYIVLGLSLLIAFWVAWGLLGLPTDTAGMTGNATQAPTQFYTFGAPAAAQPAVKHVAPWAVPLALVVMGTVWQIVFAGALARAYKTVKPDE